MLRLTVEEAQARLGELIDKALLGEGVIVAKYDKAVARIVPLTQGRRRPGGGKGQILWISPDFDGPIDDFGEYR